MTTWYLMKYSLSNGVITELRESDGWRATESDRDGDRYLSKQARDGGFHQIGKDVFPDRESAVAAAEKMRDRKIVSVQKQLKKLQAMRFET